MHITYLPLSSFLNMFLLITLLFWPTGQAISQDLDETGFSSVEERRIHFQLQQERENLEEDKKAIELREKELKTLEASVDKKLAGIDQKLEELTKLQKKIETLLAEKSDEENRKIKELSAVYEKMVPERAALAITGMEQRLATDLLANMKPKAAARILDMLDEQKASQLSTIYTNIQLE